LITCKDRFARYTCVFGIRIARKAIYIYLSRPGNNNDASNTDTSNDAPASASTTARPNGSARVVTTQKNVATHPHISALDKDSDDGSDDDSDDDNLGTLPRLNLNNKYPHPSGSPPVPPTSPQVSTRNHPVDASTKDSAANSPQPLVLESIKKKELKKASKALRKEERKREKGEAALAEKKREKKEAALAEKKKRKKEKKEKKRRAATLAGSGDKSPAASKKIEGPEKYRDDDNKGVFSLCSIQHPSTHRFSHSLILFNHPDNEEDSRPVPSVIAKGPARKHSSKIKSNKGKGGRIHHTTLLDNTSCLTLYLSLPLYPLNCHRQLFPSRESDVSSLPAQVSAELPSLYSWSHHCRLHERLYA
jgi:hypothetical protein